MFYLFVLFIAFIAGGMVILSMIVNSTLAKKVGTFQSTFISYCTALLCASLLFFLTGGYKNFSISSFNGIPFWAYLGGVLGVLIVAISNIIIPKIATIYSTLLIFVGQLFTGLLLDYFREGSVSKGKLIGGFLILAGMLYNFYLDKDDEKDSGGENKKDIKNEDIIQEPISVSD